MKKFSYLNGIIAFSLGFALVIVFPIVLSGYVPENISATYFSLIAAPIMIYLIFIRGR